MESDAWKGGDIHTHGMTHLICRKLAAPAERLEIDRRVRNGGLRRVLPGIYSPEETDTWLDRVMAAHLSRPRAVLTGPTAARLLFWDDLDDDDVHLAPARFNNPPTWIKASQTLIPRHLRERRGELPVANPALATLQMVPLHGERALTEALRRRATTVADLRSALSAWGDRTGNRERRRLVNLVRDTPWSVLERQAHTDLRRARIQGWTANHRVRVAGRVFFIDIAFEDLKVGVELDGLAHHRTLEDLTRDTTRQNLLVLDGWLILRFTSRNIDDMPSTIRRALQQRAAIGNQFTIP